MITLPRRAARAPRREPRRPAFLSGAFLPGALLAGALLAAALPGPVAAQPVVDGARVLTRDGFSLYVFDNDPPGAGRSACHGACANVFPPFQVAPGDGPAVEPFGTVVRDDGSRQWTYKGRPLYRFYADDKPGDQGGDGLNRNTWHLALR